MTTATPRLPGVFFEAPPPAREESLPRMDIAAFVGFAAAGPLHLPVAIDSPRRFRDVFGDDPALAWDEERGAFRRAHLGGAIEAFFANGGVRCWVVRVASRATAIPHQFMVPRLVDADDRHGSPAAPVLARARAVGSWCENLAVSTVLVDDALPLLGAPDTGALTLAPGGYRVNLAVDASRVQRGDLLEVRFSPGGSILLLFVERVSPVSGGMRVESSASLVSGETRGVFWVRTAVAGSPAFGVAEIETDPPIPLSEADGLSEALAAPASPPVQPTVRRLSFEMLIWQGTELHQRISDLAFGSGHPRFWAALPHDDDLFEPFAGLARPGHNATARTLDELEGLAREAISPRFPLAGPAAPAEYYLPWGMRRVRTAHEAVSLSADATSGSTALERDGLARFTADLFVDGGLAWMYAGALLREAEHQCYIAGRRLSGLHALLPIAEASLIAVPDGVHRGWTRELPQVEREPLGAPILDPIPEPDAADRYPLTWTAVEGGDAYTLQRDFDAAFTSPVTVVEGDVLTAAVSLSEACPRDVFFRVRAFHEGEVGPWSNTRGARLPREDFSACEVEMPTGLTLEFLPDGDPSGPGLVWEPEDPLAELPAEWEIEAAADPGFATAASFAPDGMIAGFAPLPERRFSARYYRIRSVAAGAYGPWSNTVRVDPTERAVFTERAAAGYDPTVLLALHRALLRFAAARGDLLAVLSLPDHYGAADALQHTGLLTPGGPEEDPAPNPVSPPVLRVPPLTEGELPVLSYGALYHPWTVTRRAEVADSPLRVVPPDGAMAGLMASIASDAGAWRAPANQPLAGVLALQPALAPDLWSRLVGGRVNVLLNHARGFLTRSEDTLGGERALGRVHVRRLMILLRRLALREGERFVFEPHGPQLRRRVRDLFQRFLGELYRRGAFDGRDADAAFRVVTDETLNRPSSVDRGQLIVELRVAPAAALALLTVRLVTAGTGRFAVEEA